MSFRNPLIRIRIRDLYQSELIEEGSFYSIKNNEGIIYNLVLLQGYITKISDIEGRDTNKITTLFVNDMSAGIWIHSSNQELVQKWKIWDFVEVIGTVEFLPNNENNMVELIIRPRNIILIAEKEQEILHIFDTSIQKSRYPTLARMAISSSQFEDVDSVQMDVTNHSNTTNITESFSNEDSDPVNGDETPESNLEKLIIEIIRTNDSGNGVSLEIIKGKLDQTNPMDEEELENLIFNLQMEGDLYEPTFRTYRVNE